MWSGNSWELPKIHSNTKVVETLTTTPQHPFHVAGKGFTAAINLALGNAIVTRAGPPLIVQSITPQAHPEGVLVYNFEVEDDHTYFVGTANGGIWVHNDCLRPAWATPGNPSKFAAWMHQIERSRTVLTTEEADTIVQEARSYGMKIRAVPDDLAGTHAAGNPWTGTPHIHVGDKEFHIPVPHGYTLPK